MFKLTVSSGCNRRRGLCVRGQGTSDDGTAGRRWRSARGGAQGAPRRRHGLIDAQAALVAVAGAQHRRSDPGQSPRRDMLALCRWAFHSRRRVVHSPASFPRRRPGRRRVRALLPPPPPPLHLHPPSGGRLVTSRPRWEGWRPPRLVPGRRLPSHRPLCRLPLLRSSVRAT